jgi:hypothetical protein
MGLKLQLLSLWTPEFFLKKGLDELAISTISGLEKLLLIQNSEFSVSYHLLFKGNILERRKNMASIHNMLVEKLVEGIGYDEAIKFGRQAMFEVGISLGRKFREKLGVGNSQDDLISAAKILYKVLGIKFKITKNSNGMIMIINHCDLAEYYSPETCKVLSAADEGVVQGLNPRIKMILDRKSVV